MKKASLSYTTVLHQVRAELELSIVEYFVADMIYHLSANPASKVQGWCYASKQYLADVLLISKGTVTSAIDKLLEKGLIEKHESTKHLRTTGKWYKYVIDRSEIDLVGQKLTPDRSNIDLQDRSEIDPNNNINNKDKDSIPDAPKVTPWSKEEFLSYRNEMISGKQPHLRIIGNYWGAKGVFIHRTKEEALKDIKRNARTAAQLVHYPEELIDQIIEYFQDYADFPWTLETVLKYTKSDIKKLRAEAQAKAERRKQYAINKT